MSLSPGKTIVRLTSLFPAVLKQKFPCS